MLKSKAHEGQSDEDWQFNPYFADPLLMLNMAIRANDLRKVKYLVQSGIDINRPFQRSSEYANRKLYGYKGFPIYHAATAGYAMTRLLLGYGAAVDTKYLAFSTA